MQESFAIGENETAGEVHDKMKEIGAGVLLQTIRGIADDSLNEKPQLSTINHQPSTLNHAPKIFTETCTIDWNKSVEEVYNLIRGLSPYPTAFAFLAGKKLKIYEVDKVPALPAIPPGEFETDKKIFLQFACNNGYISIKELQLEGKKKMNVADFLRGYKWA